MTRAEREQLETFVGILGDESRGEVTSTLLVYRTLGLLQGIINDTVGTPAWKVRRADLALKAEAQVSAKLAARVSN